MAATKRVLFGRRRAHRQQRLRARDEEDRAEPQKLAVCRQPARRKNIGHSGQHHLHLPPSRFGPPSLPDTAAGQLTHNARRSTRGLAPRPVEACSLRSAFIARLRFTYRSRNKLVLSSIGNDLLPWSSLA